MDDKFRLNIPRYSLLTEEKREFIHLATLEVLRRTGLSVKDKKALRIYHDGGCIVEGDRCKYGQKKNGSITGRSKCRKIG